MMKRLRWRLNFCGLVLMICGCVQQSQSPSTEHASKARELIGQGTWMLRRGNLAEAQAAFALSLDTAPSAQAFDGLGAVAFRGERYADAEKFFVRAVEFDPTYGRARANLALLYEQQGRAAEARGLFYSALESDPSDAPARNNFGAFLVESGHPSRGLFELRKAHALFADGTIERNIDKVERMP